MERCTLQFNPQRKVQYTLKEERLARLIFENPKADIEKLAELFFERKKKPKFPRHTLRSVMSGLEKKAAANKESFRVKKDHGGRIQYSIVNL
jgi:hypothetical protein